MVSTTKKCIATVAGAAARLPDVTRKDVLRQGLGVVLRRRRSPLADVVQLQRQQGHAKPIVRRLERGHCDLVP
jgi:hypothetical protein